MKAKQNRVSHILHRYLHDSDVSDMLRRTLIAIAVGIMAVFALCVMLVWGLRG